MLVETIRLHVVFVRRRSLIVNPVQLVVFVSTFGEPSCIVESNCQPFAKLSLERSQGVDAATHNHAIFP